MYTGKLLVDCHLYLHMWLEQFSSHTRMTQVHLSQSRTKMNKQMNIEPQPKLQNVSQLISTTNNIKIEYFTFSLPPKLLKLPIPFALIFLILEPKLNS